MSLRRSPRTLLRGTLVRLEEAARRVRLHTHDEMLLECREGRGDAARPARHHARGFDWSEGLPMMWEETEAYYYSKSEGAHGL